MSVVVLIAAGCTSKSVASKEADRKKQQNLLSAEEVVERHILASGGFELLSSMSTMHIVWTKKDNDHQWKYERWRVRGQDFAQRSFDGEVKHTLGCWVADPEVEENSLRGVMWTETGGRVFLHGGDRLKERLSETAKLDDRTRWFEMNKKIVCKAVKEVDGRECYQLEFKSAAGDRVHRYFDVETFLLVRTDRFGKNYETGAQSQQYADYKNVGGVMMPMTLTVISENRADVWNVESAELDTEIDIEQFPIPLEAVAAIDGVKKKIRLGLK